MTETNRPIPARPDSVVYARLLVTALFWGGTFIAGRSLSQDMAPFSAAFLRFVFASLFLVTMVSYREGGLPRPEKSILVSLFFLGMTGVFLYNFFFFSGLRFIPAGRASLIIAANPVFIALFAAVFFREKLSPLRIFGILLCVTGAVTVISRGNLPSLFTGDIGRGELLILGCVASWVLYSLIGKHVMGRMSPMAAVTWSCIIGAAALLPAAAAEGLFPALRDISPKNWASLFYLGFFGSALGFTWYYDGILRIGPSRAGIFINFVPLFAVALAFVILHESLDRSLLAGAFLVISGAYLTNRKTAA